MDDITAAAERVRAALLPEPRTAGSIGFYGARPVRLANSGAFADDLRLLLSVVEGLTVEEEATTLVGSWLSTECLSVEEKSRLRAHGRVFRRRWVGPWQPVDDQPASEP